MTIPVTLEERIEALEEAVGMLLQIAQVETLDPIKSASQRFRATLDVKRKALRQGVLSRTT